MKRVLAFCGAALIAAIAALPASAQGRYVERPPVTVSPDLSAPWVLQLQRAPVGAQPQPRSRAPQGMQVRVAPDPAPPVRVAPAPQPHYQQPVRQEAPRHDAPRHATPSQPAPQAAAAATAPARAVPPSTDGKYLPQTVAYQTTHKPGTIVVDTRENFLYLVGENGQARRYGVGTARSGFEWSGSETVTMKREWPDWRPPQSMIERERKKGIELPRHMPGGPANPLGARALYLGSTLYRIHGTNQASTIGGPVSAGCIRMRNEDVIDLYERVPIGTKVVVI